MQHVATACGLMAVLWLDRRFHLSAAAFACLLVFLLLHVLGARWLYSYVPYDEWCRELCGQDPGRVFGWQRNQYDRLVHFLFGLLMVRPLGEMLERAGVSGRMRRVLLIMAVVLAASAVYELAEGVIALVLAPDYAESFNGQQGDRWDPAKDMGLALAGGAVGIVVSQFARLRTAVGPRTDLQKGQKE